MADRETHVEKTETRETVTADTAALAANSAERARDAAADAIANAQIAAAGVAQQAAHEIAETQEGLSEWQNSLQRQHEQLVSRVAAHEQTMEARWKETSDHLSSILSRLAPPPETRPRPSPGSSAPSEGRPTAPPQDNPPPKRKAHRWI